MRSTLTEGSSCEVPLEAYVAGAITGEMPTGWSTAALRAQAVASRTFALHQRLAHQKRGWDVEAGTVSNAMIANAGMIRKVYFPRLLLPLSAVGAPMVDYMIASVLLAMMMVYYQCHMSWELLALPLFVATTLIAVFGVGLLLASLSVSYRDVRQLVPFVVQVGMLSTPVIWPVTIVGERFRIFLPLNPMCGTIGAFRAVVLNQPVPWGDWAISATVGVALLLAALWHFSRFERGYADVV